MSEEKKLTLDDAWKLAAARNPVRLAFRAWDGEMTRTAAEAIDSVLAGDTYSREANRGAGFDIWQDIAEAKFEVEHLAFMQTVAQAVVAIEKADRAGELKGNRHVHLGKALGLGGDKDRYAAIRAALDQAWVRWAINSDLYLDGKKKKGVYGDFRDMPADAQCAVIEGNKDLLPDPTKFDGSDGRREVRRAIASSAPEVCWDE